MISARAVWAVLACLLVTVLSAQGQKPITKNGLLRALQIGGLSSHELIEQVNKRGVDFALTAGVENELTTAGATPELMEAVRRRAKVTSVPPPITPPPVVPDSAPAKVIPDRPVAPPPPKQANFRTGVYVRRNGNWTELLPEGVLWKREGNLKKFTIGMGKNEMVGTVPGGVSPNTVENPVSFLIATDMGISANDYMLVELHDKRGMREIRVNPAGDSRNLVPFSARKVGDRSYQLEFSQGAGEYAFVSPGKASGSGDVSLSSQVFTFRVK